MRICPRCQTCFQDDVEYCIEDKSPTKSSMGGSVVIARRYKLVRLLGRGAFGVDYLALDQQFRARNCSLKIVWEDLFLSDENPNAATQLESAALALTSIQHPNVLDISDYGFAENGHFFLVSDYSDGETLHRVLRREVTLPPQLALSIAIQAARGLWAAHEKDVLHLDLRPATIILTNSPTETVHAKQTSLVRVTEFSLSSWLNAGDFDYGIVGTPVYTAPEQFVTGTKFDGRTDIYALGTILYEMLAGRPPFTGEVVQLISEKITRDPPPLRSFRPEISESLESVVMKAISREVEARPLNMLDWLIELEKVYQDLLPKDDPPRSTHPQANDSQASATDLSPVEYDVFISYRRQTSSETARAIRAELRQQGVRVFLDVDELRAGHFDTALLDCIARTPNFLLILTPNSLDRCDEKEDWLRQEIAQAIKCKKNLIPVTMPGFEFPELTQIPEEIRPLQVHQRVRYDHEYFDAMISKIIRYLQKPN